MKSEQSVVTEFLCRELTYAIIGAAREVHRILGPGFLESVYGEALAHEFGLRDIPYHRQAELAVRYKDIIAGEFRADFLVDGKVVVELKAVKALAEGDEAQLLNYLKGTGYRVGLLLNFGAASLEHRPRVL
ncbi:MAG: GxxExxY protein [Candidatus Oleimicrobiaceae bacterium]